MGNFLLGILEVLVLVTGSPKHVGRHWLDTAEPGGEVRGASLSDGQGLP